MLKVTFKYTDCIKRICECENAHCAHDSKSKMTVNGETRCAVVTGNVYSVGGICKLFLCDICRENYAYLSVGWEVKEEMKPTKLEIHFGNANALLYQQIAAQGYTIDSQICATLQRLDDAISILKVFELITADAATKARTLLMLQIEKYVTEFHRGLYG